MTNLSACAKDFEWRDYFRTFPDLVSIKWPRSAEKFEILRNQCILHNEITDLGRDITYLVLRRGSQAR
jgi:hypothetical protein